MERTLGVRASSKGTNFGEYGNSRCRGRDRVRILHLKVIDCPHTYQYLAYRSLETGELVDKREV